MTNRNRVIWTIVAILSGVVYFLVMNWTSPKAVDRVYGNASVQDLNVFYDGANDYYFDGRLKKAIITFDDTTTDEYAYTEIRIDGTPLIHFNPKAVIGQRYSHLTLEHEMCHVEAAPLTGDAIVDHGARWKACMLRLDMMDANRDQLIDTYKKRN